MPMQNVQAEFVEAVFTELKTVSESTLTLNGVMPTENLSIYKNNIKANLIHSLEETYPLIIKLVGHDFFRLTAKEYIKRYPARSSNLHDYGEYFSHFLAHYQPLKDLVYLAEVAQFEWACHTVFFAAEHVPFDLELLKDLTPDQYEKINFLLNPASQLIKCYFPILDIIDLCKNKIDGDIDVRKGGVNLLIIRRNFEISLDPLTLSEFTFLSAIQTGNNLMQALKETETIDTHFKLEEKLPEWIQANIIVGYTLSE